MSAGSTNTSLWTHYNAGEREYCGNKFPDGMRKNDMLEQQVITPTTKAATHDVPISAQDIVKQGIVSQQDWDQVNHKLVICHVTFDMLILAPQPHLQLPLGACMCCAGQG